MAKPQLQIEKRLDNLEQAVRTLAQTGFGPDEVEEVERILRGESDAGSESEGRVQVREEGEDVPDEEAGSEARSSDPGEQEQVGEDVDPPSEDQS